MLTMPYNFTITLHPLVVERLRRAAPLMPAAQINREILHHFAGVEKSPLVAELQATRWPEVATKQPRQKSISTTGTVNSQCAAILHEKACKTPTQRGHRVHADGTSTPEFMTLATLAARIIETLMLHPADTALIRTYTPGRPKVEVKSKPSQMAFSLTPETVALLEKTLKGHRISKSYFLTLLIDDLADGTNKARTALAMHPSIQPMRRSAKSEAMLSTPPKRTEHQKVELFKEKLIELTVPTLPPRPPVQTDDELDASMKELFTQHKAPVKLYPLSPAEIKAKAELAAFVERGEKEFGLAAPLTPAGLPTPQPTADNAALTPPDEPGAPNRRFMVYWNGQHMTANRCASEIECDPAFAAGIDKPVRSDQPYHDPVEEMMAAHVAARAQVST